MPVDTRPAEKLLAWYGAHARALPWRSPPGAAAPDPYRVWLSEVMLQQTTVAAVIPYFERFTQAWPDVTALAAADDADVMRAWAGLGYYARARNLLACARIVAQTGFPADEAGLRALPGIGTYTAAAIAAIAFGRRAVVVDGNVERVVARLFAVETPLPAARPELRRLTDAITPEARAGDFAQAMMDLGSAICTPRAPACAACPLQPDCRAAARGEPATWPRRLAKPARPGRHGTAWWIVREGQVRLVRRAAKGLLGGMRALPSDDWHGAPQKGALIGRVAHVFTHFRLTLDIRDGAAWMPPPDGEWWPLDRLDEAGLPSLFARAARAAMKGPATTAAAPTPR